MSKTSISSDKKKENKEAKKNDYYQKIQSYLKNGISTHGDILCFIDVEANDNKAISLGAICYNQKTKEVTNTFYSLMKFDSFMDKNYYETSIHKIPNEDILKAKSSDEVFELFIEFCKENNVSDMFSWGNRDKEFLRKSLTDKSLMDKICKIRNIQTFVSAIAINYKENMEKANISLQKAKNIYGIDGDVIHNALSDAFDLQKVFVCFQQQRVDKEESKNEFNVCIA
jgi:inhibitor of KinA sporulation pathway (predicted exonuclease)